MAILTTGTKIDFCPDFNRCNIGPKLNGDHWLQALPTHPNISFGA
jgi:hypothetical protein